MITTKRLQFSFIIVTFVIFLLLPFFGILFQIKGDGEGLQNRTLYGLPEVSVGSILSGSFGKKINEYVWDHLPLRSQLIRADHWLDYYVFKDSPVPDNVLLGREGCLFLYPSVMEWPQMNAEQADLFVELAWQATQLQKKSGKKIYIVPSPNKASIYPEFLYEVNRKEFLRYSSFFHERLQVAASSGAQSLLLLWEPFLKEKSRLLNKGNSNKQLAGRVDYLFRPRDRHFSWETSRFQAQKIVEVVAPGLWGNNNYEPYFSKYKIDKSEMERTFLKIHLPEPYVFFLEKKFLEDLSIIKKITPDSKAGEKIVTFTAVSSPNNNPLQQRIVVIHDSFFLQSMYFLAPYFKESVFIPWGEKNMPIVENEIRNADIVVIQSVEGHWSWRYPQLKLILDNLAEQPGKIEY